MANSLSNNSSILLGNSNGTFRSALNCAGPTPSFIALRDFDRDGNTDVAVVNDANDGTISILLGNGNGSLPTTLSFAAGPNPAFIVAADFNLDGKLDLAIANTRADTVSIP